ncbi:MAG: kelch repeat-containing protein [Thermomicrobiales bacterium]
MRFGRSGHRATLLPDGRVLVTGGGSKQRIEPGPRMTEIYDPETDRWSDAGLLIADRAGAHRDGARRWAGLSLRRLSDRDVRRTAQLGRIWRSGEGRWRTSPGLDVPISSTTTPLPAGRC